MKKRRLLVMVVCLLVLIISVCIGLKATDNRQPQQQAEKLSKGEFEDEQRKLKNLFEQSGIESSFNYVREQSQKNSSFARDCHPLLHRFGQAMFLEYDNFDKAILEADEVCNSGYVHGLIEANFAEADSIKQAIASSCTDYSKQEFKQWQCFHGVGHGIMYSNNKNHLKSIAGCRQLKSAFATNSCINGVFMERFITVSHGGEVNHHADADISLCKKQESSVKRDCYYYAPTAFLDDADNQPADVYQYCKKAETEYIRDCVFGVGSQVMKNNISNPTLVAQFCQDAIDEYAEYCASGAISLYANHFASTKKSEPLCENQFKSFQALCRTTLVHKKAQLKI